jgi:hypothetical protein
MLRRGWLGRSVLLLVLVCQVRFDGDAVFQQDRSEAKTE